MLVKKILVSNMSHLSCVVGQLVFYSLTDNCQYSWLQYQTCWQDPVPEDTSFLSHKTWRNQAGKLLGVSLLLSGARNAGKYYAHCQKRNVILNFTHPRTLKPMLGKLGLPVR